MGSRAEPGTISGDHTMSLSHRLRASAAALTAMAGLLVAAPALAAPAPAPSAPATAPVSESELLGRRLAHGFLQDMGELKPMLDLVMAMGESEMKKQASAKGGVGEKAYARFGVWFKLAGDAAWEEFEHDRPAFEVIIGRFMAKRFTETELRAAVELFDGPYGKEIRTSMMGSIASHNAGAPTLTPAAGKAMSRFANSEAGSSFLAKMKDLDKDPAFEDAAFDAVAEWMPGVMRRWGEKAEAAEEARKAAN